MVGNCVGDRRTWMVYFVQFAYRCPYIEQNSCQIENHQNAHSQPYTHSRTTKPNNTSTIRTNRHRNQTGPTKKHTSKQNARKRHILRVPPQRHKSKHYQTHTRTIHIHHPDKHTDNQTGPSENTPPEKNTKIRHILRVPPQRHISQHKREHAGRTTFPK